MNLRQKQGYLIKALREEKGITQEELAYRSQVSIDAIRQIERGVKMARTETFFKVCEGLGVSPAKLYEPLWDFWQSQKPPLS